MIHPYDLDSFVIKYSIYIKLFICCLFNVAVSISEILESNGRMINK
jgi:hypothetical protein